MNKVITIVDCSILDGYRGEGKQTIAYKEGRSKVQFPDSMHNSFPSRAVDAVPFPVDWEDTERMAHFAGIVIGVGAAMGITIRWGSDWDRDGDIHEHSFLDYPHFEVI